MTGPPTTLVLRALGLGDLLVAIPALRALRRAVPGHHVALAAPAVLSPLVDGIDAVDQLVPCAEPAALADAWSGGPAPDLGVNLHGDGTTSRDALLGVAPVRYVGETVGGSGPVGHERERWCRLLEREGLLGGVDAATAARDLRLGEHRSGPDAPIVVHPGAAFGAKRWPTERFAAVAAALDGAHHPVIVTGSTDDRTRTAVVVATAGLGPDRDRGGRLGIAELADLVAGAALLVSGDTGVAHLASAFGTPSVVLFGPVATDRWGPPPGPHRTLGVDGARRGDPFAPDPDPALLGVGVDDVLAAARDLLAA